MIDLIKHFFLISYSTSTEFLNDLGGAFSLYIHSIRETFTKPFYFKILCEQIYEIGLKSFVLVAITALSTGFVMTLQFGYGLEKFGGKLYVPKVVALSIIRELGPVFTSLMLAARVGAGIAAEVGSMQVTQQIDAIRALGTSPIKKIVIPRILAASISLPILTVFANIIGISGGMLIGYTELDLSPHFFYAKVLEAITLKDFFVGIIKTLFFGFLISLTGCYSGISTTGGTQGVGLSTTKSVVTSSILVVISDFFLTKLFWILEKN